MNLGTLSGPHWTGPGDGRYQWSVYHFTDADVPKLAELTMRWSMADTQRPIDARRYHRNIIHYAEAVKLIERFPNGRHYISQNSHSFSWRLLPIAVVWHIFDTEIYHPAEGHKVQGYSITREPGWGYLNLHSWWEGRDPGYDNREEMQAILIALHQWHYVYFQWAGTIWSVERMTDERA